MDIQYLGHSAFRLRGKEGLVVTDPFPNSVGFSMGSVSADVVTISHHHFDHDAASVVKGTARRPQPYIIDHAGEYEVGGITVYGYPSWHDNVGGGERGANLLFSIYLDDVHILHLGDVGHVLSPATLDEIPPVDVLLCPVGGVFTIGPEQAEEVIASLEPSYVIPMHYRTPHHDQEKFGQLLSLNDFLAKMGKTAPPQDSLKVTAGKDDDAETQVVVLDPKVNGS